jgi:hypothetical protein
MEFIDQLIVVGRLLLEIKPFPLTILYRHHELGHCRLLIKYTHIVLKFDILKSRNVYKLTVIVERAKCMPIPMNRPI